MLRRARLKPEPRSQRAPTTGLPGIAQTKPAYLQGYLDAQDSVSHHHGCGAYGENCCKAALFAGYLCQAKTSLAAARGHFRIQGYEHGLDLAVSNMNSNTVAILLNDGIGAFTLGG